MVITDKPILNKLITEYRWGLPNYEVKNDDIYDRDFKMVSLWCNAYRSMRSPGENMDYPKRCGTPIFTARDLASENNYVSMFITCSGCIAKYRICYYWNAEKQVLEPGPTILKGVKDRNIEIFERYKEHILNVNINS